MVVVEIKQMKESIIDKALRILSRNRRAMTISALLESMM
jgi:hypothetical protein